MFDALGKVYVAMVLSEMKDAHCGPEKLKMDGCEMIGFFKDEESAEKALIENANELVMRTGFKYAMIGAFNVGELQPLPLTVKFYKAELYEADKPYVDQTTYDVYYHKEEQYRFVAAEADEKRHIK